MNHRIKNKFDLSGKVAIITGASKGIGESMARGLAEHGAQVVVSSRKQEAVDQVAAQLTADGFDAIGIECHVGDEDQLKNLVDKTISHYGGIDIVINNAASNPVFGPLTNINGEIFDKIMNINVKAALLLNNLCVESMKTRGGGSIINIASVAGLKPSQGMGIYSVTKSALIMLTQNQANELGQFNIRCNAICPGLIKTKFSQALWTNEKILGQVEGHLALGRMAEPDEMAGLAVYLASDASSYTTGGAFTSDGGHMLT